ncbi:error-prone DNA polymerase [Xanthomonas citri pv. citri]|uniref:Error-prone DNA polymerase n=8 Tax=Xanthomonas TaxID=338 RepID=DNAE2_XANAC|nr:error-prone DNA polymerase [Xanthomonas citri]Q8PN74.2 RecName: Full=Error-prone DNA polymerase [Xanthomonas citri pv. citri str. 306]AJD67785.1 DNA polymerase III, alpha subunit [Xanthomonas citri subsp. citri A306]AJY90164.1 DNA polymerase III, alpha subunit [Xanthomonas citri pv. citri]AJZ07906.1 DNA polymerase III, alpha subunit [Xanthomonas citri pv. citri]AJZ30073.1 DNA polymerase III, alpha subunit [Xanthomonas citri pv. citri]AJZ34536.1 DNA polymerase III, alpha subunit [Xanthomona
MSWDDAIDGVDRDTPGGRMPRAWNVAARLRAANDDIVHAQQADGLPAYAELHCLSDFSFLRGASSAEQLFARAQQCGYSALAITDECSLAGIVRGLEASRATGVRLIVGSEFTLVDGTRFVLLVENAHGYPQLCGLITTARRAASKGAYRLDRAEVQAQFRDVAPGVFALWLPGAQPQAEQGAWLQQVFGERAFLAVELHREQDDVARLHVLQALAQQLGMTALASGDVHMAQRRERIVQDTLTAIRHTLPLAECGAHLFRNGERHLRTRRALGNIYPDALLQATVELAQRCTFDISKISYTYPRELVPEGHTPTSYLRQLTEAGIRRRWPGGITAKVREDIEKELALIALKKYEAFFLTVQDVVRFAREQNILCQGRGSSANSAVCYALGITAVNPDETRLLMARFLSEKRDEPPDIDVDFEHERREEVLQYVYSKYGRERAALAATVICYRGKSAVRDVAKAFGLPPDQIALLANCYGWGNGETPMDQRIEEAGFDLANPLINKILAVTEHLRDHPRHLSQHVGGFVISDEPLSLLVPVENAAMANRTIIQWDKDDLETMKLLKVDCLALGMLTCIRKTLDLVRGHRGRNYSIATLPGGDAPTYKMIQRADTVGVFQIESRAQMAMLPRLKPAAFYDLVIEVAIVRPGPIQGDMVHPYLRRRQGREEVNYPSPAVEDILKPTLGVPLFQEQVMELLMHAADYSEDEADNLRRSMAAWRRGGDMEQHRTRVRERMQGKGYASSFIDQIFEQIKGFGSYGFPQSHAASFAKLVYASCWLKRHEPAAFACGLLNAQPMGFYSASQIVQDARRGSPERERVEVLPVDVLHSDWDNTLVGGRPWRSAADPGEQPAIRLGMRQVAGLSQVVAQRIVAARTQRAFADIGDLCLRAALDEKARLALAEAGALQGMVGNRNAARWAMAGVEARCPLLPGSPEERPVEFEAPRAGEEILADYRSVGLSLRQHPMALLRPQMRQRRILGLRELQGRRHGSGVHVAGLVTQRQRPATAKGTIFVTLEDEQGMINVIVWSHLALRRRRALLESRLLAVRGRWERVDGVEHLIAGDLYDLSNLLGDMQLPSRDFH